MYIKGDFFISRPGKITHITLNKFAQETMPVYDDFFFQKPLCVMKTWPIFLFSNDIWFQRKVIVDPPLCLICEFTQDDVINFLRGNNQPSNIFFHTKSAPPQYKYIFLVTFWLINNVTFWSRNNTKKTWLFKLTMCVFLCILKLTKFQVSLD